MPEISALYAGLCALLMLALAANVVRTRAREKVDFGDGDNLALQQAIRVHGNAVENVPLALLLLVLLELHGAPALALHLLGAALFIGRILHAQGLASSVSTSIGRLVGTIFTWTVLAVEAIWLILLAM